MRPFPVDYSLWMAIGHASRLDPDSFSKPSREDVSACLSLLDRTLDAGADPNAEFTSPSREGERIHLTCMERAFGQLHGDLLVPLLERAIEKGWRADRLPSGLWAAGQSHPETIVNAPQPDPWRLSARLLQEEPGWLQLLTRGSPWGKSEVSARLCHLLIAANAPLVRPAQARVDREDEAMWAHREMDDPLSLAIATGGNLDVALALVQEGILAHWVSAEALKIVSGFVRNLEFREDGSATANILISLLKSHTQAVELELSSSSCITPPAPRRSL